MALMNLPAKGREALVSAAGARAMDAEAAAEWSLNGFALVEAAGRRAAQVLAEAYPRLFEPPGPAVVVLAGRGNNAADALVILRALILGGLAAAERALVITAGGPDGCGPRSEAFASLQKMGVRGLAFSESALEAEIRDYPAGPLAQARLVIDGIAGTGLSGPLREDAALLARQARNCAGRPLFVSVDLPSGLSDAWKPGMPVAEADAVLAIEPEKRCLYNPAARPLCGRILHVGGVFPAALTEKYREADLVSWDYCRTLVPPCPADSYKYSRGLAEIRAGSPGASGAARIAARGAQAAGAGLVRLLVDPPLYPVLASSASSVMVDTCEARPGRESRFAPDALLLGPGWGRGPERLRPLEDALALEERGVPLVLDADAVFLARDRVFHGNALLTPHPGELAAYSGIAREELLADPAPALRDLAGRKRAVFLFKSHVMIAAAPDGRLAVLDGMNPALGSGGSGDLLAGFCAGIAARCRGADLFSCALAGAALLIRAAADPGLRNRFFDSMEVADLAADLAGRAWLPGCAGRPGGGG
ncbi:MAG: bifunctional ADP-dependent NAD(P)H-hydrate dehydratase/NAD(P)H-hydrate epimerase [Treponema sp.]|jgi:NAD(P)H-hydrate epimerase|nr:bifunctional ADP-dependent NAD(P)H-hydrate dehydratase/NAD(P)H-hydrate epimerase [Treponema sp.]